MSRNRLAKRLLHFNAAFGRLGKPSVPRRTAALPVMMKAVAAASIAALLLSGCSLLPAEEAALQPPLVKPAQEKFDVVEVKKGSVSTFLKGTANFVASRTQSLSFRETGGRIKEIHVNLGQSVKAGDLLIDLETGDLELQARLQQLNVEQAQIVYGEAKRSGLQGSELRLKEIDLERERIAMESLNERVAKARLVSPINGVVTYIAEINAGDSVTAFSPVITIADPSKLLLTYQAVSAKDLLAVQPNMEATFTYKNKSYKGRVLQSPSNAPVTADKDAAARNSTTLVLGMDGVPSDVQIGESADFSIPLQKADNVLVLPRAGVRSYLGRDYVQVQEGERRKEVDVELGLKTSTQVEIVRGLEEGQKVILNN